MALNCFTLSCFNLRETLFKWGEWAHKLNFIFLFQSLLSLAQKINSGQNLLCFFLSVTSTFLIQKKNIQTIKNAKNQKFFIDFSRLIFNKKLKKEPIFFLN